MQLAKPGYKRYAFAHLDTVAYNEYASKYSTAKKCGIRAVYSWSLGTEAYGVVVEFMKGSVREWGRRQFTIAIAGYVGYFCSPIIVFITNSRKIINGTKRIHNSIAYVIECAENIFNLCWLPLDFALFGQPIPLGDEGRMSMFKNFTDFLD